eukprot:XP_001708172.1 Hypothetical protein GL50803_35934 [Giardia lamblia ATCC 50803]
MWPFIGVGEAEVVTALSVKKGCNGVLPGKVFKLLLRTFRLSQTGVNCQVPLGVHRQKTVANHLWVDRGEHFSKDGSQVCGENTCSLKNKIKSVSHFARAYDYAARQGQNMKRGHVACFKGALQQGRNNPDVAGHKRHKHLLDISCQHRRFPGGANVYKCFIQKRLKGSVDQYVVGVAHCHVFRSMRNTRCAGNIIEIFVANV